MAKISTKKVHDALQLLPKVGEFFVHLRNKIYAFFKKFVYWSGVSVVGLLLTGTIMHYAGVPVFEVAEAVDAGKSLAILMGNILYYGWIGPVNGTIMVVLAYILQAIINYPHGDFWTQTVGDDDVAVGFVNVEAVITGWKLVRDICNIFFSIILVVIALGSVLKIEKYSWKQLLPKFIVMAILINFSKSIAGVFTDLATIAMATFGGSFGETFAWGLLSAFGTPSLVEFSPNTGVDEYSSTSAVDIVGAFLAAAIMSLVFGIVMVVLVAVFMARIVMLWFLIVLSPLAYVGRILPLTSGQASKWWNMFGRWVMVGPLMTFFLWLSLTMAYGVNGGNPIGSEAFGDEVSGNAAARLGTEAPGSGFQATSTSQMATFLVATVMIFGSLKLVKDFASEAGALTAKAEGLGRGAFTGAIKGASMRRLTAGVGGALDTTGRVTSALGADRFGRSISWVGNKVDPILTGIAGTAFNPEGVIQNIGERISTSRKNQQAAFDAKYAGIMDGAAEKTDGWVGRGAGRGGGLAAGLHLLTAGLASAGKNGQTAWDSTFSLKGAGRMGAQLWNGRDLAKELGQEKDLESQLEDINNGNTFTKENHAQMQELVDLKSKQDAKSRQTQLADFKLNGNDSVVDSVVSEQIKKLEKQKKRHEKNKDGAAADAVQDQIDVLQKEMARGDGAATLDRIQGSLGANGSQIAADIMRGLKSKYGAEAAKNEQKATTMNDKFQAAGGNFDNLVSKKAIEKQLDTVRQSIASRQVYSMPINMQARAAASAAVKDEADKMQGMSKVQLRAQLQLALKTGNSSKGQAALKELSGKYGGISDVMKSLGGSVDFKGAQNMAKELQGKLGLGEQGSYQLMNQLIDKGGLAHLSGMFIDSAKGWTDVSKGARERADELFKQTGQKTKYNEIYKAAISNSKENMRSTGAGKLAREHGMMAFLETNDNGDSALSESGLEALKSASKALSEPKAFGGLSDQFKADLSKPEYLKAMRDAGVNPKFIAQLQEFRNTAT